MERRPNLVDFKVSYDLQKGGFVLKSREQNFHFEFWTIIFVLLCLGYSCRGGVCILNITESTNSTNHTSDRQARNFASVANSIFENLEGNFQTKQKYKLTQSWVSVKKRRKICISEIHSWVEAFLKEDLLFSPAEQWEFGPWLQCIPLSTKWFVQNSNSLGSIVGAWSEHTACNCLVFKKLIIKQMCRVLRKFVEYVWWYECVGAVLW